MNINHKFQLGIEILLINHEIRWRVILYEIKIFKFTTINFLEKMIIDKNDNVIDNCDKFPTFINLYLILQKLILIYYIFDCYYQNMTINFRSQSVSY